MKTIEEHIWQNALDYRDKTAVKSAGQSISYGKLPGHICGAADFYRSLPDYALGRSVIIAAEKQIEFLYAYFGAHLAGLTVTPVAADINQDRLAYIAKIINPFAIIGFDAECPLATTKASFSQFSAIPPAMKTDCTFPSQETVADILFTTGTTGTPKGVPLTYANELAAATQINQYVRNQPEDVELLALPVSHSFGLGRLRCCLVNGQTIILLGSFVNIKKIFRTIEEEQVTGFTMVPASWKFLQKVSGNALAQYANQLKYIEFGSSFFSEEDKRHFASLFPKTRVTMHYGLTEASRSTFMEFHEDGGALHSIGKATPGVEIGIFNDNGKKVTAGTEGEICIRGAHVMQGYILSEIRDAFYGDYFRTGDSGVMSENGYVYLRSRIKEIINVGGKKVAPIEVDEQILKIPGVVDCACVGVPDPDGILGEVVKGCVVREENSELTFEQIAAFLAKKLENYKVPVVWQWIEKVPKTHNGKILRGELK